MILDNENKNPKVYQWIQDNTKNGKLDIVTGYFTIGALTYLSNKLNQEINQYRMILGDIVSRESKDERPLDLLNENISIEACFTLNKLAREAVEFLKQQKVEVKTLEPNFCHAKAYIHQRESKNPREHYYITGSSNLTEAGIGLRVNNNIELNIAGSGDSPQYGELVEWFNNLWKNPKAHNKKTILNEKGKIEKVDFKEYLINEIQKIFKEYTPEEIFYKILYELYGVDISLNMKDPDFALKIGRLEDTKIFQTLYPFQQKGALSLIKILQKYNGAILADAVGLGKTWTALGVMKYFMREGYEIILICPKKLQMNWRRYLRKQMSKFESDNFDYTIRFHTDFQDTRLETNHSDGLRIKEYFQSEKPKLFVIDESHNFRNSKSGRYRMFMDEILKHKNNQNVKVLLLSATPINNNLNDIRNQYYLMVKEQDDGFYETLDIRNLTYEFKRAQTIYMDWCAKKDRKVSDLKLPDSFRKLTDNLTVARTRTMVLSIQSDLKFPKKNKPENIYETPTFIGNFETFYELFDAFPPYLSAYSPALYIARKEGVTALEDEQQRDMYLVRMMYILLVKRLESSWFSFMTTVEKILIYHQSVLDKIKGYEKGKNQTKIEVTSDDISIDEGDEEYELGKKRPIRISEIEAAGKLLKIHYI